MKIQIEMVRIATLPGRGSAAKHEMLIGRDLGASEVQPEF
jgi:hypothetical protein